MEVFSPINQHLMLSVETGPVRPGSCSLFVSPKSKQKGGPGVATLRICFGRHRLATCFRTRVVQVDSRKH
jgi:hypothetical protein